MKFLIHTTFVEHLVAEYGSYDAESMQKFLWYNFGLNALYKGLFRDEVEYLVDTDQLDVECAIMLRVYSADPAVMDDYGNEPVLIAEYFFIEV